MQSQLKSHKNEDLGDNAVDAERIYLTIDSGCAACALPVGVASAVGMEELNRTTQEYIAANAEKIRELGFKIPTLKFQNGDVQNLKFSVMDKIAQTSGGSVQARRSRQSDRAATRKSRWFFHRRCRSAGNESLNEVEYTCSRVRSL